jgi:pSer/pThr/pTyr-binding forkhead associated (FHA) protein
MGGEQLCVTEGKERGRLLTVEADLLIGRLAPEDEGRLGGDAEISRRHARVSRGANRQLAIEDLGSANGTFVNDERISGPRMLQVGDVIRVGKTVLEVTDGAAEIAEEARPVAEPPTTAGVALVVTAGTALGRRLTLTDELLIGRGVSGEGRLSEDVELSRRHARVARSPAGQLTIEDLGSANGTFVNGERIDGPRELGVGDSVRVGSTVLELAPAASAPEAAPPPPEVPARPPVRSRTPVVSTAELESELPRGSVFAGCRLERVISHGDMGVVYAAEELALQRPVALKLILPEFSGNERFRERFRRESTIAAAIDHPNVIPVFDAGEEQGVLFIMMRLVEGTDLRALIDAEGPLEPLRAARIVGQVGAALDAAHARGMLHRDIKPSNVLLAREDHVYLTDFGLAKREASGDALTRQGTIVARAEYVAPEQILGDRVDARADVYALGCLLFEVLTGEPPFATRPGAPDMLAHADAPRSSPRELRPDLPAAFDDVVHRATAVDPAGRYPSAGDLGQAALVAAGGLRRAGPWSVVATGEVAPIAAGTSIPEGAPIGVAAPIAEADRSRSEPAVAAGQAAQRRAGEGARAASQATAPKAAQEGRSDLVRWMIALASLAFVAIGMVAALHGISTL